MNHFNAFGDCVWTLEMQVQIFQALIIYSFIGWLWLKTLKQHANWVFLRLSSPPTTLTGKHWAVSDELVKGLKWSTRNLYSILHATSSNIIQTFSCHVGLLLWRFKIFLVDLQNILLRGLRSNFKTHKLISFGGLYGGKWWLIIVPRNLGIF
jgi:hypothetical protein